MACRNPAEVRRRFDCQWSCGRTPVVDRTPDSDSAVPARRCKPAAVGAPVDRGHFVGMTVQPQDLRANDGIPYSDGGVPTCTRQTLSVLAPCERIDSACVP